MEDTNNLPLCFTKHTVYYRNYKLPRGELEYIQFTSGDDKYARLVPSTPIPFGSFQDKVLESGMGPATTSPIGVEWYKIKYETIIEKSSYSFNFTETLITDQDFVGTLHKLFLDYVEKIGGIENIYF